MTTGSQTASWIASLPDSGIAADLTNLAGGGSLNYGAALQILTDVAKQGPVTTAEVTSLQAVAAHLNNGLAASQYVASVFTQLVGGSPENATWTGGAASSVALGNLQAGTTAGQMNELIGKWFLGTDLPDPDVFGMTPVYQASSLPLYGATGAAAASDIVEGQVGTCEFLAGVIDLATNHPDQLASMIVDNGNGSYGVRFYINGNATWVTVNNEIADNANGTPAFEGNGLPLTEIWANLVEKAYVQLSATGLTGHPAVNIYSNINGNSGLNVLENLSGAGNVTYYFSAGKSTSDWNTVKAAILSDMQSHDDVIVESGADYNLTDSNGNITLVSDHGHAVVGYDSATGDFILRNPWGAQPYQNWDTQFEVSMSEIASVNGCFCVDNSGSQNSPITVSSAPQIMLANASTAVSTLFRVTDTTVAAVKEYALQLSGTGRLALNGAVDIASAAQSAQGQIVVSASDLAKVTLAAGAAASTTDLLVSAYDGTNWSPACDIPLTASSTSLSVAPKLGLSLAPGATVSAASLLAVTGDAGWYDFIVPAGGGTLNLNGAQNVWPNPTAGEYQIAANQLSLVTYTAPSTAGSVTLNVNVCDAAWAGWLSVSIAVNNEPVAEALQDFANGQTDGIAGGVTDSAALVFANLDGLQSALAAGVLNGVILTDAATPTETLAAGTIAKDFGALSLISSAYLLAVTDSATAVMANLDAIETLAAAGHVARITLTDSGTPILAVTGAQLINDAAALQEISGKYSLAVTGASAASAVTLDTAGHLASASISDSAANLGAGLDGLASLAATGKLTTITLTDTGIPNLTVTQAQFAADKAVLSDISSTHTVTVEMNGTAGQYNFASGQFSGATALQFTDQTVIVAAAPGSPAVTTGNVTELYAAVLGREPDIAGLAFYQTYLKANPGTPLLQFAEWFLASPEYSSAHSYAQTTAGDAQFITDSYENLLHRTPNADEVAYYQTNVMAPALKGLTPGSQAYSDAEFQAHAQMLVYFSASPEFLTDVQITAQNPASLQHWLLLT